MARSSSTADIQAAADAFDFTRYIQEILDAFHYHDSIILTSDSRHVFSLGASTKKPEEVINLVDLSSIRLAFNHGKLDVLKWSLDIA